MAKCNSKCKRDDHFKWSRVAMADVLEIAEEDKDRADKLNTNTKLSLKGTIEQLVLDHPKFGCPVAYQKKKRQDAPDKVVLNASGATLEIVVLFHFDPVPTIHWEIVSLQ